LYGGWGGTFGLCCGFGGFCGVWDVVVEAAKEGSLEVAIAEVAGEDDEWESGECDEGDAGVEWGEETGGELENEGVGEVDGVGPVAEGFEEGEMTDDAGAFEFERAEEEEGCEGSVEDGSEPGAGDDGFRGRGGDDGG